MWTSMLRLSVLTVGLSVFATGCHRERPQLAMSVAASAPTEPLTMRVVDASERGRRIRVKAWLANYGDHDILVDRDALGLRLASGRVLPVSSIRHHRSYVFAPGRGRMLKVDFRVDGDIGDMSQASLTMGASDARPLTPPPAETTCTTVPPGAVIVIGGTPGVIPSMPPRPAEAPRAPSAKTAPPAALPPVAPAPSDDDNDDADETPEPEAWQVGGGRTR